MAINRCLSHDLLAIALLATLCHGCAITKVTVPMPTTSATTSYSGGAGRTIIVNEVIDSRDVKNRIGMKKNGFGWDMASAYASQDVAPWLRARMSSELANSGFSTVETAAPPSAPSITIRLTKLFIEPVVQWSTVDLEADLAIVVLARLPSGTELERRYYVKGTHGGLFGTDGLYSSALTKAIDSLVNRVVPDLINLINEGPTTQGKS